MTDRPECISKLAFYLESKEPLIYLFIINSDFIEAPEELFGCIAGVKFENRRVKFLYDKEKLEKLPSDELFFLVMHEAYHIFKKHLIRFAKIENRLLMNIATDAVINYEIEHLNFSYELRPKILDGAVALPREFIEEFRDLKEDAIVTERVYHWILSQKTKKKDLLRPGAKVKVKSTGEYGKISKDLGNDNYEVKKDDGNKSNHHEDDLIPVVKIGKDGKGIPFNPDFEVEYETEGDKHFDGEKGDEEDGSVEERLFTEKLVKQAREIAKNAGNESNSGFLNSVEKLLQPKINWKRELNKRINIFYSTNSFLKKKILSPITYPWNPRSNYDILCNHWLTMVQKIQTYIIFAIDTSGSVFSDSYDLENFFTEVDSASKELEFSKTGSILTFQWDTEITEGLKPYKRGDWKSYKLKGGGGTTPQVAFKYLNKIFEEKNGHYFVNTKDVKFVTRDKTNLPFLIFLTDGEFFHPMKEDDLGIYSANKKNVLYFTRNEKMVYPQNYVLYQ
jgi:predicted metal-dependent peptidase